MFLYCNFLSDQNSLSRCYLIPDDSVPDGQVSVDFTANGFRLPTQDEWKIANLAGSRRVYFYGDSYDQLSLFANKSGEATTTPIMMFPPNAWGLFDTLGNVAEACHPSRESGIVKYVNFQGDSMMKRTDDHPGGLSNALILDEKSFFGKSIHGFRVVCNR
jgi:formylglycine-generating enzyme required for sulfatase activity